MSPSPRGQFTAALTAMSQWVRLASDVPAVIVRPPPTVQPPSPLPLLLWFHGRSVNKELDPGRYARLARVGVATCAIDLPGHGERSDAALQAPEATLRVVSQAVDEVDPILESLRQMGDFAMDRVAIGGMSAGGMVTMVRLCRAHSFRAALLESTTGSWKHQSHRAMWDAGIVEALNPIDHLAGADASDEGNRLGGWREIPVLSLHNTHDEWVDVRGAREFTEALRARARHPAAIQLHEYQGGGAPSEHAGFGRFGADAKDRGTAFLREALFSV